MQCDLDCIVYYKCVSRQDIKISISLVYWLEPVHGTKRAIYNILGARDEIILMI